MSQVNGYACRKEGRPGSPGKEPGEGKLRKAAGAVLPGRGRFSPLGRETGASRSDRGLAEVRRRCRGPAAYSPNLELEQRPRGVLHL